MAQSSHHHDHRYSVKDVNAFNRWLAEARADAGLCRDAADIRNHGLMLLIKMIDNDVRTLLNSENLGVVYSLLSTSSTQVGTRTYDGSSDITTSSPQRSRSRATSTEPPRKRRRQLPDHAQRRDGNYTRLQSPTAESWRRQCYAETPASLAEPVSTEPAVLQGDEDNDRTVRCLSQEAVASSAGVRDTSRSRAAIRIPKTLNGLRQQMASTGSMCAVRRTDCLDTLFQLREELGGQADVVLQEEDYYSVGDLLFCRIFGNDVQGRLYELVTEHDAAGAYRQDSGACRVDRLAEKLQRSSLDDLASFVRSWGEVTDTAVRAGTSWGRLQVYWRQYDLWKRWHKLKELSQSAGPRRAELLGFLKSQNIETRHGKTLESCLADFFAAELELPGNTKFGDTIYRFAAVGTLVDAFGRGILAFLPKGLDTWYKSFRSGGKLSPKKLKLEVVCQFIAGKMPSLKELCDAAEVSIVEKVINGQPIEMTRAVYDIRRGKSREDVLQLPLVDFVTPEVRRGECSEVFSDDGDDEAGSRR